MKFVLLAVLLAILIAFIVMVVKAAKNWRWYHITAAVITMLLAILFLFPTAASLKSRQAWHKIKEELEVRLAQVKAEYQSLQYGDPTDPSAPPGVKAVSLELSKIGTEAGRRWRSLQMAGNDGNGQIMLRSTGNAAVPEIPGVTPDADAAAAANNAGPLVPVGLVVYAFAEGSFPNLEQTVPIAYLGEFKVTASTNEAVTVTPTFELEANQVNLISSGQARIWSLYEMLPLDGHAPFIAEGSRPSDDNSLGRVDDDLVNMLFKNSKPETRDAYLRDGTREAPEDPAARWVKIKFEKKYEIDVDSEEQRGALEGGFFDNTGRAVDSRLQRSDNGKVAFAVGDTIIVKEEAARQLINQEQVASLVDTYYLRPLNDYRYILRKIRLQIREMDVRITEMQYQEKILNTAIAATVDMLAKRQDEKLKLEQDVAQYQVENAAIQQYYGQIREELREVKEASSALFKDNYRMMLQIKQLAADANLTKT
ncbi:hypothetical protein [Rhodopirellula sp. MGV]|uniref:hypothetical protein n=1 Tax=Rhodopirellula sp. MGV TaxID=2023130 RepID=UPI000B95DDE1|nr:hypothetical protein [Rhodopirellula sp. MGV]OYP29426.1 hypothetical protein CGZ80_24790 [Rhodopirellula sp. MGV]PNY35732.1 hypothetical protein C2E31_16745 [Rhodopirellula baltica]